MSIGFLGGITFLLVFGGMILIHELGHFVVARLLGIEVEEFGIGFPPRMITLFSWKGTVFSLNWIPLGGFNRIKGENDPTVPGGLAAANPWKRIVVLIAGPLMNLLTAVFTFSLLFNQIGLPDTKTVVIAEVTAASPAEMAGIQANDTILRVGSEDIHNIQQLRTYTRNHLDQPMIVTLQRGGKTIEITVTPLSSRTEQQGAMGVLLANPMRPPSSWFATLPYSFSTTYENIRSLLSLPGRILAGSIAPSEAQLMGPRSVWNLFQQAVARDVQSRTTASGGTPTQAPTNYTLIVIINLTLSLGILNLFPIPALDGGRILFTLPEIIFRRRVPPKFENLVHGIGLILLLLLLSYFYIMDIVHPINLNLP